MKRSLTKLVTVAAMAAFTLSACVLEEATRSDRFDDDDDDGAGGEYYGGDYGEGGEGGEFSSSTSSSSSSTSSSSSSTSSTSTSSTSSGTGGTGGNNCPDNMEPNDNETHAEDLGTIDDCDSSGSTISSALSGDDEDWFVFDGEDHWNCSVNPTFSIVDDGQTRVCAYFQCLGVDVTCNDGAAPEDSPAGRPGCCAQGGFSVSLNCTGSSDDATVFMRVEKPNYACVNYDLSYHY